MRIKKQSKRQERYIPLSDIEKIDDAYLSEMERVKTRLGHVKDEAIIKAFHDVLLSSYNAAIEIKTLEREVDYNIKLAEIRAREDEQKPWRRCWLWRLLLQPLTNRAQDIIEARAALEADIIHTDEEKAIEDERRKFKADNGEKLSKRELKRLMRDKLKAVIEKADNADVNEAFAEPPSLGDNADTGQAFYKRFLPPQEEQADTTAAAPIVDTEPAEQRNNVESTQAQEQTPPQEQLRLDVLPNVRKARPPRSCRRP